MMESNNEYSITVDSYAVCEPFERVSKQHHIIGFSSEGNFGAPLVYLQRPKHIKSDAVWEQIVEGINLNIPKGFKVE